jgi:hypothetical protein
MKTSSLLLRLHTPGTLAVIVLAAWPGSAWGKAVGTALIDGLAVWFGPYGYSDGVSILLWGLLFGFLTVVGPRLTWTAYSQYTGAFVAGAASAAVLAEFEKAPRDRNFLGAGLGGALFGLCIPLIFLVIGPIGLYLTVAQSLMHRYDGADRALCCFDIRPIKPENWDITGDGRYMVVAGSQAPSLFFGTDSPWGRMYAIDLQRGRFVPWTQREGVVDHGLAFASEPILNFKNVVLARDGSAARVHYTHGMHDPGEDIVRLDHLYREGRRPAVRPVNVRFRLNGFVGDSLSVVDVRTGNPHVLGVDPRATRAIASPDGSVVAVVVFPPKDKWSLTWAGRIEFWDVARGERVRRYKLLLMPEERNLQLRSSADGRTWVMVVDGTIKVFLLRV